MPHATASPEPAPGFPVIEFDKVNNIGGASIAFQTFEELKKTFVEAKWSGTRPSLPEELLYDDKGLDLWAKLIYSEDYYQTKDEISLLKANAQTITKLAGIDHGTTFIDLGAGDTRKVMNLLDYLEERGINCNYYALDISHASLQKNIERLTGRYSHVRVAGLWGTFANLMDICSAIPGRPRVFLSLGSVLFNDDRERAIDNLRGWAETMREDDIILAGMDGHSWPMDKDKILASYHSRGSKGPWDRFWCNGFARANKVIGHDYFNLNDWDVLGEVQNNPVRHQFIFRAKRDVSMDSLGIEFRKGEEWDWFDAHKNGPDQVGEMCNQVGLEVFWKKNMEPSKMWQYLIRFQ